MEVLTALVLLVSLVGGCLGEITPRIGGGVPVDTLSKFAHHVTIHTTTISGESRFCSGSIIADQWILTSIGCTSGGNEFRLDFNRMYLNHSRGSYSAIVDSSSLVVYPTEYDDLALLKLPMKLLFNRWVKPIALYEGGGNYGSNFAVMPGFSEESESDKLNYGMFKIIPKESCQNTYGPVFDKYLQLCTLGWNNNRNTPCKGNEGGGLIVGWPKKPQLIGVFSNPFNCDGKSPAIYMEVTKYIPWIRSIVGDLETAHPPITDMPTITPVSTTTSTNPTPTTAAT